MLLFPSILAETSDGPDRTPADDHVKFGVGNRRARIVIALAQVKNTSSVAGEVEAS